MCVYCNVLDAEVCETMFSSEEWQLLITLRIRYLLIKCERSVFISLKIIVTKSNMPANGDRQPAPFPAYYGT
jgi:hypothetical protein